MFLFSPLSLSGTYKQTEATAKRRRQRTRSTKSRKFEKLIFFLGPSVVPDGVLVFMTVMLVITNVVFLVISTYNFVKVLIHEILEKKKRLRRRTNNMDNNIGLDDSDSHAVQIADSTEDGSGEAAADEDDDDELNWATGRGRLQKKHTNETISHAHSVHEHFHQHNEGVKKKIEKGQQKARRQTLNRVEARAKLRQSRALHKIPAFATLSDAGIDAIIEVTTLVKREREDVLIEEGGIADKFFVLMEGVCSVWQLSTWSLQKDAGSRKLATLKPLTFFGETMMLGGSRNATVKVCLTKVRSNIRRTFG